MEAVRIILANPLQPARLYTKYMEEVMIHTCENCGYKFTYKVSPCEKQCPNCGHRADCNA